MINTLSRKYFRKYYLCGICKANSRKEKGGDIIKAMKQLNGPQFYLRNNLNLIAMICDDIARHLYIIQIILGGTNFEGD